VVLGCPTSDIIDSQRIEVNRSRTPLDELDKTWLELSQNLRERPGGGYEFQGPVALNFATQATSAWRWGR